MEKIQCPAGEHCLKKERGDICLMWHPLSNSETTEQRNPNSGRVCKEQAEEEMLVQLAVKRSLDDLKLHCQFCKSEVSSMDDLHLHQLDCAKMEETGLSDTETGRQKEKKLERRSTRVKKPTERYQAYTVSLAEYESDLEEKSEKHNHEKKENKEESEGDNDENEEESEEDDDHKEEETEVDDENEIEEEEKVKGELEEESKAEEKEEEEEESSENHVNKMMKRLSLEEIPDRVTIELEINKNSPTETRFTISPDSQDCIETEDCDEANDEELSEYSRMENELQVSIRKVSPPDLDTPSLSPARLANSQEEEKGDAGNLKVNFVDVALDVSRMLDDIDELLGENTLDISKLQCVNCEDCKEKERRIEELESKVQRLILELNEKESIVRDSTHEISDKINEIKRLKEESEEGRKLKEDHLKISEKVKKISETAKNKTSDLKARNQDILKLQQTVVDVERISQNRKNDNDKLRKIIIDKEQELKTNKVEISRLVKRLETNPSEEIIVSRLKNENKELKATVADRDQVLKTKEIEITQLNEKCSVFEKQGEKSCKNVNELVSEIRSRTDDLQAKEEDIERLRLKLTTETAMVKRLEENLEQSRDENIKVKNKLKETKVNSKEATSQYEEFIQFKEQVNLEMAQLKKLFKNNSKRTERLSSIDSSNERSEESDTSQVSHHRKSRLKNGKGSNGKEQSAKISQESKQSKQRTQANIKPIKNNRIDISYESELDDHNLKRVPGNRSYKDTLVEGSKTMIFSTSIRKRINIQDFNADLREGTAEFIRFPGKKAQHIRNYVKSHLALERPQQVIIQAGGNDLPTGPLNRPVPIDEIANHLIETGEICRRYGVKKICIGGVTARPRLQGRCYSLNDLLKQMCTDHDFTYINNSNISLSHLYDGVHINDPGSKILSRNFLNVLNVDEN